MKAVVTILENDLEIEYAFEMGIIYLTSTVPDSIF